MNTNTSTQTSQPTVPLFVAVPEDLPQPIPPLSSSGGSNDLSGETSFVLVLIVFTVVLNNLRK